MVFDYIIWTKPCHPRFSDDRSELADRHFDLKDDLFKTSLEAPWTSTCQTQVSAEVKGEVPLSLSKAVSPVALLVALPPFWDYESLGLGWLIFRVDIAYVLYVYGAAVAIVLLT